MTASPDTLKQTISTRKQTNIKEQAENDLITEQQTAFTNKINQLATILTTGQDALVFLETVAVSRRSSLKQQIEQIVTEALQIVYGNELTVELQYDVKNGRSFVDIRIIKDTPAGKVSRTMEGIGGGVSDTVSVPLRLLVLLASRTTDKVCILDEAYKHVDLERVERAAGFIQEIASRLGIQIIMSSHHEAMLEAADTVHTVSETTGLSAVTRTK
jgi:hypothetical protein